MNMFYCNIMLALLTPFAMSAIGGQADAAATAEEPNFMPSYRVEETVLELSGVGVLTYMGLFRIYAGGLYLPPEVGPGRVLEDIPKRLEVKYLRSIDAEDFGRATIDGINRNVDPATYSRLAARIAYHNSLYEDMAAGDRASLTYIPSVGTTVAVNGNAKGIIPGAEFAKALFSMWLGDRPFDRKFKRALLGESYERK